MNQDQLTRNERVRLEALGQANAYCAMRNVDPDTVMEVARKFEQFIKEADLQQ